MSRPDALAELSASADRTQVYEVVEASDYDIQNNAIPVGWEVSARWDSFHGSRLDLLRRAESISAAASLVLELKASVDAEFEERRTAA